MLEELRQRLAPIFEEAEQTHGSSVVLSQIFLWLVVAGIIGGISPFILPTNHRLLVSLLTSATFIILTAKPLSKWLVILHS